MPTAPTDTRNYVRVAVDLPSNGKVSGLTTAAKWLHVVGIIVAGRDRTDGHIRPRVVAAEADVPDRTVAALIKAERWHEQDHACPDCPQPIPGHVYIHHFLKHQRSKSDADAATESARRGASLTNHKRYHRTKVVEDCWWCPRYSDQGSDHYGDQGSDQ